MFSTVERIAFTGMEAYGQDKHRNEGGYGMRLHGYWIGYGKRLRCQNIATVWLWSMFAHMAELLAETRSTRYFLDEGILISEMKPGHVMNLDDAVQNLEAREKLQIPYPLPVLMDIRTLQDATIESIIATSNPRDAKNFTAAALVLSETVHELMSREGKRFRKQQLPVRVFMDKDKAMRWLKGFAAD